MKRDGAASGAFARARGRFAEVESYLTGEPQRPLEVVEAPPLATQDEVEALIDLTIAKATEAERADFLAYLDRRIANAAAVEASTAPDAETREIAGDRRRQMEVIRDEIAQGQHVGLAELLGDLRQAQVKRDSG